MTDTDSRYRYMDHLVSIAGEDVEGLREAQKSYGDSWKRRGGTGAWMMACRKFDRLEQQLPKHGYDVFAAAQADQRAEGVLDDIRDLRRYLLLIESEIRVLGINPRHRDNA